LKDLPMSLLSRSAYIRQLLPSVGVAVSMAAEAESSIKLACVHDKSETFRACVVWFGAGARR
jgi:hypothetical protein